MLDLKQYDMADIIEDLIKQAGICHVLECVQYAVGTGNLIDKLCQQFGLKRDVNRMPPENDDGIRRILNKFIDKYNTDLQREVCNEHREMQEELLNDRQRELKWMS